MDILDRFVGCGCGARAIDRPGLHPWLEINCRHVDINITTGKVRYSRWLWFVKISETIRDTPLSLALNGKTVELVPRKPWHRLYTFSPGIPHSLRCRFHSTLIQAYEFELFASAARLTPEET